MDTHGFQLDKTRIRYTVDPQKASKGSTSASVTVKISHTHRRGFYVRTDDGDFHVKQDEERFRAFKPFTVDSTLFALQDTSLKSRIRQALAAAMVRPETREAIIDEMMEEGIRMVKGCDGGGGGAISVDVATRQNFVCFEVVGEN